MHETVQTSIALIRDTRTETDRKSRTKTDRSVLGPGGSWTPGWIILDDDYSTFIVIEPKLSVNQPPLETASPFGLLHKNKIVRKPCDTEFTKPKIKIIKTKSSVKIIFLMKEKI